MQRDSVIVRGVLHETCEVGEAMKSFLRMGVNVVVLLFNGAARAAEVATALPAPPQNQEQASLPPYPKDWDKRLGDDFFTRLVNYYALEWGRTEPPSDPTAPPSRPTWSFPCWSV